MTRPRESDYTSHTSYTRALEDYCDLLESKYTPLFVVEKNYLRPLRSAQLNEGDELYLKPSKVYDITNAEPPPPDSGFAKL